MPDTDESAPTCGTQTYRYDNGVQTARFCGKPATRVTEALDGSRNNGCDDHAASAIDAGAREVMSAVVHERADNDTIFGPPRHREQTGECTLCGEQWPCAAGRVSPDEQDYDDAFDVCPEPTCLLYDRAVMADHRHLPKRAPSPEIDGYCVCGTRLDGGEAPDCGVREHREKALAARAHAAMTTPDEPVCTTPERCVNQHKYSVGCPLAPQDSGAKSKADPVPTPQPPTMAQVGESHRLMHEAESGRSPSPVEVVTDWFAGDLTWHAFQVMSDGEMATAVLAALEAAGYVVTAPARTSTPEERLRRFVAAHERSHPKHGVMVNASDAWSDQDGALLTIGDLRALVAKMAPATTPAAVDAVSTQGRAHGVDEMQARGVRAKHLTYVDALLDALRAGVPISLLVGWGIPAQDVTEWARRLDLLPPGASDA